MSVDIKAQIMRDMEALDRRTTRKLFVVWLKVVVVKATLSAVASLVGFLPIWVLLWMLGENVAPVAGIWTAWCATDFLKSYSPRWRDWREQYKPRNSEALEAYLTADLEDAE